MIPTRGWLTAFSSPVLAENNDRLVLHGETACRVRERSLRARDLVRGASADLVGGFRNADQAGAEHGIGRPHAARRVDRQFAACGERAGGNVMPPVLAPRKTEPLQREELLVRRRVGDLDNVEGTV